MRRQPSVLHLEHPVHPRRQLQVVGGDQGGDAGVPDQAEQQVEDRRRRSCGPGCRSARRPGRIRGSLASARAIATRCCSPPESWPGRCFTRSDRPTMPSRRSARDPRLRAAYPPRSSAAAPRFSRAVNSGSRWWNWYDEADLLLRRIAVRSASPSRVQSVPSIVTRPPSGAPAARRGAGRVDLPAPEGPTRATISPGARVRSAPVSTSSRRPPACSKLRVTPANSEQRPGGGRGGGSVARGLTHSAGPPRDRGGPPARTGRSSTRS